MSVCLLKHFRRKSHLHVYHTDPVAAPAAYQYEEKKMVDDEETILNEQKDNEKDNEIDNKTARWMELAELI